MYTLERGNKKLEKGYLPDIILAGPSPCNAKLNSLPLTSY